MERIKLERENRERAKKVKKYNEKKGQLCLSQQKPMLATKQTYKENFSFI